jgi:putative protease
MDKKLVGKVSHFFSKISVAVIDLVGELKTGDKISIEGANTGVFEQMVSSIQIEHEKVDSAGAGQSIGLKMDGKVREGDSVYKLMG